MSMRKTRAKKQEELDDVLTDVLDLDIDSIVQKVLRGLARVTSVEMLLGMSRDDLLSFKYVDSLGSAPEKINRSKASLIRAFKGYV